MAKKKKGARINYGFQCSTCKSQNYITERNKINTPDKLESNKYCSVCKKHTIHKEMKRLH